MSRPEHVKLSFRQCPILVTCDVHNFPTQMTRSLDGRRVIMTRNLMVGCFAIWQTYEITAGDRKCVIIPKTCHNKFGIIIHCEHIIFSVAFIAFGAVLGTHLITEDSCATPLTPVDH